MAVAQSLDFTGTDGSPPSGFTVYTSTGASAVLQGGKLRLTTGSNASYDNPVRITSDVANVADVTVSFDVTPQNANESYLSVLMRSFGRNVDLGADSIRIEVGIYGGMTMDIVYPNGSTGNIVPYQAIAGFAVGTVMHVEFSMLAATFAARVWTGDIRPADPTMDIDDGTYHLNAGALGLTLNGGNQANSQNSWDVDNWRVTVPDEVHVTSATATARASATSTRNSTRTTVAGARAGASATAARSTRRTSAGAAVARARSTSTTTSTRVSARTGTVTARTTSTTTSSRSSSGAARASATASAVVGAVEVHTTTGTASMRASAGCSVTTTRLRAPEARAKATTSSVGASVHAATAVAASLARAKAVAATSRATTGLAKAVTRALAGGGAVHPTRGLARAVATASAISGADRRPRVDLDVVAELLPTWRGHLDQPTVVAAVQPPTVRAEVG